MVVRVIRVGYAGKARGVPTWVPTSERRIGDYVGHLSAYMTDAYRHLLDGAEAEAASRLDSYLERSVGEGVFCV